jgi:hypothetical protein
MRTEGRVPEAHTLHSPLVLYVSITASVVDNEIYLSISVVKHMVHQSRGSLNNKAITFSGLGYEVEILLLQ